MARTSIILLSSGGLRSLVATALVRSWPDTGAVTLLHLAPASVTAERSRRAEFARRQAESFESCRFACAEATFPELRRSQLLLRALAEASKVGAGAIVWPAAFNGDVSLIARASEQAMLARQLAATELPKPAVIDLPLVEFTDRQIIELGAALDVPWELAWSCEQDGDEPCSRCHACQRRRLAFDAAGIIDRLCEPATP